MKIKIAREIAARIWGDPQMSNVEMDSVLAEKIAQLLADQIQKPPLRLRLRAKIARRRAL